MILKLIRLVVGKLILLLDALFSPKPMPRDPEEKARVDAEARPLALYQFESCPFCVKVRRAIRRLNVEIELRDALKGPHREELAREGGELQVPCLRIEEGGKARWLYESDAIIEYLEGRFGRRLPA